MNDFNARTVALFIPDQQLFVNPKEENVCLAPKVDGLHLGLAV
jgi:hypothetical protein